MVEEIEPQLDDEDGQGNQEDCKERKLDILWLEMELCSLLEPVSYTHLTLPTICSV